MAEWSNAPDLKSDEFKIPWVQIPLSPFNLPTNPFLTLNLITLFYLLFQF